MLFSEEKYAIFISLFNDCQCQLIDKWQYCLMKSMACNTHNRYGITKELLRPKVPWGGNANCEKIIFIHFEGQKLL